VTEPKPTRTPVADVRPAEPADNITPIVDTEVKPGVKPEITPLPPVDLVPAPGEKPVELPRPPEREPVKDEKPATNADSGT
jgi:hypothetical protein